MSNDTTDDSGSLIPPPDTTTGRSAITTASAATLACVWEVVASKPGNVNRNADFTDLNLIDFLNSATMIGQATSDLGITPEDEQTLGRLVHSMVRSTQSLCRTNSNLGIALLFAPIILAQATAPVGSNSLASLQKKTSDILLEADVEDSHQIYTAIHLANPSGLGTVAEKDIGNPHSLTSSDTPVVIMQMAAKRDSIASEYATDFKITFETTAPTLYRFYQAGYGLHWTILGTFIELLSQVPDTLILRKLGRTLAEDISAKASAIRGRWYADHLPGATEFAESMQEEIVEQLSELDFYLRCDGNKRNPGTTADLIAAGLFVCLLTGILPTNPNW